MPDYRAKGHYQQEDVAQGYDQERFQSWHGRIAHQVEAKALRNALEKYCKISGTILDIPCGTGRLFSVLLEAGHHVLGGDISDEMMKVARTRYDGISAVRFQQLDAEKMDLADNSVDYLTSYRLMTHLPHDIRLRVLDEMIRVTKKILIINFHFKVNTPLYVFNQCFRKSSCPAFPLDLTTFQKELSERQDVVLLGIHRLSWYERSSALVILRKQSQ